MIIQKIIKSNIVKTNKHGNVVTEILNFHFYQCYASFQNEGISFDLRCISKVPIKTKKMH